MIEDNNEQIRKNEKYAETHTEKTEELTNSPHLTKTNQKQTILDTLMKKYSETFNRIDIAKEFRKNIETTFDIKKPLKIQKDGIIKKRYEPYLKGNLNIEQQELLNELRNVFLEDGRSDVEIIDLACNSFKYLFMINYKYAKRDIETLINIKTNNSEFIMIKENDSHFDDMGIIGIDEIYNIDTFNHELTHAIHWYSTQNKVPESFENQTFEINEEKFNEFIEQFVSQRMEIVEKLKQNNYDFYNENTRAKEEKNYNQRIKEILENAEKNNSYPPEIINYLKENIAPEEEYKMYYNKVSINEFSYLYIEDYKESIIDIVDALKKGKVYDEGIKICNSIKQIGHGLDYYSREKKDFIEIIANYNEIIKSPYKEEALNTLEKIIGIELLEILEEFNEELVVEPLENKKQR